MSLNNENKAGVKIKKNVLGISKIILSLKEST